VEGYKSAGGTVTFKYDPSGRRIYKSSFSVTRYFHTDGLGSITSLSNAAGSIANTYTYDSFGKLTASTGSLVNPFQYTARESDSETGLYYYRARYYDQSTGRFISEDPIGFHAKQINFYAYVSNTPLNLLDPTGMRSWNKLSNFMNCLDGCVKTMLDSNWCTLKKNLKKAVIAAPLIGVGTCTLIVVSEPYLAPAYLPCVGLTVGSTFAIMASGSIGRWNIENLSSGVGCTAFCSLNELR
jgi:RHS repeat-associated protein